MPENEEYENWEYDPVFGMRQEFEFKYGETTKDGIPRFGDDYSYLHKPSELTLTDRFLSLFFN